MPERVHTLIPALLRAINGKAKLGFFAHSCTGLSRECHNVAMQHGAEIFKTVSLPLAYGNSLPATIHMMYDARRMEIDVTVDEQRLREIDDYFYWSAYVEQKPLGQPVQFDPVECRKYAAHQIPGGMMSNLENQLSELGLLHKLPEVLEEAGRVRQELGYPVMVTPFSQLVGVQAVFNVVEGERYRTIPQELELYVRGAYGRPAAPIDPNVIDRILVRKDMETIDPSNGFDEPLVSKVRAEKGPFRSDEELLLAIFNTQETMEKFYQNKKPIELHPVVQRPLAALIKELAKRRDIKMVKIQKGSLKISQVF
jgi:pyruvate/oxaloacetate carboxyltransferase